MSDARHSWCKDQKKRSYTSKKSARRAHEKSGDRLRYYRCKTCLGWHASSRIGYARRPQPQGPKGGRPRPTPKDPKLHKFVSLAGTDRCFVCARSSEAHETRASP